MNFVNFVKNVQDRTDSFVSVGLDIDAEKIPDFLKNKKDGLWIFIKEIIDATSDVVCAYKVNFAFFEAMGEKGWKLLKKVSQAIPDNLISIADGKRGDIGNTSEMYAKSIFKELNFTSATVNPYMGFDSVEPFIKDESRGIFLLALTSNKGAKDFQSLKVGKRKLFEEVIHQTKKWSNNNIGYVIGATKSSELLNIRKIIPNAPLLIPGIGAQGGDLKSVVKNGITKNGRIIINSSRAILYASSGVDFAEAARKETIRLREEINSNLKK